MSMITLNRERYTMTPGGRRVRISAIGGAYDKQIYTVYLGHSLVGTWDTIDLPHDWDFFLTRIDARCDKYRLS
jgi:hypothetical protein